MHRCSHANFIQNEELHPLRKSGQSHYGFMTSLNSKAESGPILRELARFYRCCVLKLLPPAFQSSSLIIFPLWNFVWPTHIFFSHPTNLLPFPSCNSCKSFERTELSMNAIEALKLAGRSVYGQSLFWELQLLAYGFLLHLCVFSFSPPPIILVCCCWCSPFESRRDFTFKPLSATAERQRLERLLKMKERKQEKNRRRNICRSQYLWSAVFWSLYRVLFYKFSCRNGWLYSISGVASASEVAPVVFCFDQ